MPIQGPTGARSGDHTQAPPGHTYQGTSPVRRRFKQTVMIGQGPRRRSLRAFATGPRIAAVRSSNACAAAGRSRRCNCDAALTQAMHAINLEAAAAGVHKQTGSFADGRLGFAGCYGWPMESESSWFVPSVIFTLKESNPPLMLHVKSMLNAFAEPAGILSVNPV